MIENHLVLPFADPDDDEVIEPDPDEAYEIERQERIDDECACDLRRALELNDLLIGIAMLPALARRTKPDFSGEE